MRKCNSSKILVFNKWIYNKVYSESAILMIRKNNFKKNWKTPEKGSDKCKDIGINTIDKHSKNIIMLFP